MKKTLVILFLLTQVVLTAQSTEKDHLISKLINAQGSIESFKTVLDGMIEIQKSAYPFLDDEFWNKVTQEMKKDNFSELISLLTPIYDKHFNEEQLIDIIDFYESETGKHLVSHKSDILLESMSVGAEWGGEIGEKIVEEIKASDEFNYHIELDDCEDFKTGKFKMLLPDSTEVLIVRTKESQTESYRGELKEHEIEWISNCRYKILGVKLGPEMEQKDLIVNIYSVEENICKTISTFEDVQIYDKAEMIKIE